MMKRIEKMNVIQHYFYMRSLGFTDWGFFKTWKIHRWARKNLKKQKTCKHEKWNFKQHGRCCFDCGIFMVDFGD